jgi:hypothetical protein
MSEFMRQVAAPANRRMAMIVDDASSATIEYGDCGESGALPTSK